MTAHAVLGPSAAEAWWNCPDYPNAVRGIDKGSSKASAEGTAAHQVSDECLALGMDPIDFVGGYIRVDRWAFEISEEMADFLQPGIDRIREFEGKFFGEQRVNISKWTMPGQFGTLDRSVIGRKLIVISDLKYGYDPVPAVENKQLMLYALGLWWDIARHITSAKDFLIIIDQPRNPKGGGEWRVSLDELLKFGEEAKKRAQQHLGRRPERVATEKGCKWCPKKEYVNGGCAAYDKMRFDTLGIEFDDLDDAVVSGKKLKPRRKEGLSIEEQVAVWRSAPEIKKWLDSISASLHHEAEMGFAAPGTKLVAGRRGTAKYVDPSKAERFLVRKLRDGAFTKKLISPAQAKKLFKGEDARAFWGLVERGEPKPILVDANDARPALEIGDMFDDLTEGDTTST